MMYEEKWGEIVIDWLSEDYALKKKLRRNNKNIFEGLKKIGFTGSYRTIYNFIKEEWKEKILEDSDELKEEYERLTHPPAENQECFLDGLKMLFHQAGFVPRKLRLDNLSAAVVKVRGHGHETFFNEEFLRFANHYGFEARACNARKGNEKGHVENKVGYVHYNFFTPSPIMKDFVDLRDQLLKKCEENQHRPHYVKDSLIADLFAEEKKYGLALPESEYPVFKQSVVTANKYGEVRIDGSLIHIPKRYHYGKLQLILYWDTYKVVSLNGEMLSKGPRPYMNQEKEIPWQSILQNWRQKPRSIMYSRYFLTCRVEFLTT